jgi:hypothetical protein
VANRPKAIGTKAETIVVKVAQRNGFPYARRNVLAGTADKGDVHLGDGTDTIIEVKGGKQCASLTAGKMAKWIAETRCEARNAGAKYAFLVTQVKGKGEANAELWWAHIPWEFQEALTGKRPPGEYGTFILQEALNLVENALRGPVYPNGN